jgi:hypothetical protein
MSGKHGDARCSQRRALPKMNHAAAGLKTLNESAFQGRGIIFALQLDCPFFGYELTGVSR